MSVSKIEQVARTLRMAWGKRTGTLLKDWNALHQDDRNGWLAEARAAIGVMREPTDAMIGVGGNAIASGVDCHVDWTTLADDCHRAMIDAALGEKP